MCPAWSGTAAASTLGKMYLMKINRCVYTGAGCGVIVVPDQIKWLLEPIYRTATYDSKLGRQRNGVY